MDLGQGLFSPVPSSPVEKVRTAYNRAFVNWQSFWVEAYRDQSFYLNNQWTQEERRYLQQEQRPDYCYNLVRSCINMVQGYQRKHRHSIVFESVRDKASKTATQFTKCMYHSMRYGKGHYAISDAFKGALVTGIGFVGLSMDYRFDPRDGGDLVYDFLPWNSVITDPFWTRLDFSDCDYIIRRAYMSKEEAISRFKDKEAEITRMQGNTRDELFTFLPEQRIFQSQNLLAYTEYWEQQYEEVNVIINPMTLQEIEINDSNRKTLSPLLKFPGIKHYKKQKKKIKFYALLNNELIKEETNPYNLNEYPFIPVVASYSPEYDLFQYKLQSLGRCVRDAQIEFNKVVSKMRDFIDSQINTGWIIKKSKFDNPMDFYKSGQGRVIFGKNEADLNADARQLNPSPIPAGLMELQNMFSQLIMRICGVNEELLGAAEGDVGIVEMLRQGAGLINLQDLFDNLRQSSEIIGNRSLKMMQNNFTPEKVMKITGEEPTEDFYDDNFGKYDAVCAEAPLTETQQQLFFNQLMSFKAAGMNIPDSTIIKAMPMTGKDELLEDIQAQEQQTQQMQQMEMQMQMQDKAVVNELLIHEGQAKLAAAKEKVAKAEEDRALAMYHRAKTHKELEGMDMDNINKFIDTLLKIEGKEKEEVKEEIKSGE